MTINQLRLSLNELIKLSPRYGEHELKVRFISGDGVKIIVLNDSLLPRAGERIVFIEGQTK